MWEDQSVSRNDLLRTTVMNVQFSTTHRLIVLQSKFELPQGHVGTGTAIVSLDREGEEVRRGKGRGGRERMGG